MNDPDRRPERGGHATHELLLAGLEGALAAGSEPDPALDDDLVRCPSCGVEAARLITAAGRLRRAARSHILDLEPSPRVRDRVRAAVLQGRPQPPPNRAPKGATRGFFASLGWAGVGAAAGALALALALTLGTATPPAAAAFTLTGSELAPGASGLVTLRPLAGGSTAMTVAVSGIPASKPGEFYELWWVGAEKRHVSCGTFRSDGSPLNLAFTSGVDVATTVLIEITLERDDGDPAPGPHVAQ